MAVNPVYSSTNRITGMYSDMDTDTLVQNLLRTQQNRVDKQYQSKTKTEWKNEAISAMVSEIRAFSNNYFSVLGENSLMKSSVYYNYNVSTEDTSGAVGLKASGDSVSVSSTKIAVYQLAKQCSISSRSGISAAGESEIAANNNTRLRDLKLGNKLQFDDNGEISFEINGKAFTFSENDTLQGMLNTINSDKDANVTMKYSRLTDSFTLSSDVDGADGKLAVKNLTGNAFGENSAFGILNGGWQNGQNAIAYIDGKKVEKGTNEFTADGITYTLNKVTTNETDIEKAMDEDAVSFSIERDYSVTVDAIKKFISDYNDLYSRIDALINSTEKDISRSYPPLTDAQKEGLSDTEIEKWESMAKKDLLRRDSDLTNLLTQMRSAVYSALGGTGMNLTSIGITTGSYYIKDERNKLILDEDTLMSALRNDSDSVIQMFTSNDRSSSESSGITYRLNDIMNSYVKKSGDIVTDNEGKISKIEDKISSLEEKLAKQAEKLYNKYAAMETALAKLNSQSQYIASMFSM